MLLLLIISRVLSLHISQSNEEQRRQELEDEALARALQESEREARANVSQDDLFLDVPVIYIGMSSPESTCFGSSVQSDTDIWFPAKQ